MKHPKVTAMVREVERLFGLDGVRVYWPDGRVFEFKDGRWQKCPDRQ